MKRKYRSLILSIFSITGIILVLIFLWFVSREYRFKTYKDIDNVFSVKYPATWTIQLNTQGASAIFVSPLENSLDTFRESVNIVIQDLSSNPVGLNQYTNTAINQMQAVFKNNFELLDSSYYYMAGHSGHKIVFITKRPDMGITLKYKIVWTVVDTTAYQVTYTALPETYEKYINKVNIMMGSFKLLKQEEF